MSVNVFQSMIGQTMKSVVGKAGQDEMVFVSENGRRFTFYHDQGCCESVAIEDVCGDLTDLVGSPMLEAEEVDNMNGPNPYEGDDYPESYTYTFYRFGTAKGCVVVRWLGTSNGYYSESVEMREDEAPIEPELKAEVAAEPTEPVGPVSMPIRSWAASSCGGPFAI